MFRQPKRYNEAASFEHIANSTGCLLDSSVVKISQPHEIIVDRSDDKTKTGDVQSYNSASCERIDAQDVTVLIQDADAIPNRIPPSQSVCKRGSFWPLFE